MAITYVARRGDREEVSLRVGFSWSAFFVHVFWLAAHRIWRWCAVWCLLIVVGALMYGASMNVKTNANEARALMSCALVLNTIIHFVAGFMGNEWRRRAFVRRGYVISNVYLDGRPVPYRTDSCSSSDVEVSLDRHDHPRAPCPYCAEDIRPQAVKCRFCQSDLSEGWAKATSRVKVAPSPAAAATPACARDATAPDTADGSAIPAQEEVVTPHVVPPNTAPSSAFTVLIVLYFVAFVGLVVVMLPHCAAE